MQLCAQALCLEEMHNITVPEGALFYGEVRRRHQVEFDDTLRNLTLQTIQACRVLSNLKSPQKPFFKQANAEIVH